MSLQRLHMHGLEEASAGQMRQPSRVVAVGLVGGERLERLVGLSAPDADHLNCHKRHSRRCPQRMRRTAMDGIDACGIPSGTTAICGYC